MDGHRADEERNVHTRGGGRPTGAERPSRDLWPNLFYLLHFFLKKKYFNKSYILKDEILKLCSVSYIHPSDPTEGELRKKNR